MKGLRCLPEVATGDPDPRNSVDLLVDPTSLASVHLGAQGHVPSSPGHTLALWMIMVL